MRPLVCEFLSTHSFAELESQHGVVARPSRDRSKVSLNYDQISAHDGDPIVECCRGLVLRTVTLDLTDDAWKDTVVGETIVMARPMDRFYNHGQGAAKHVNLTSSSTRFYEKLDGTMCLLYHDDVKDRWCVATRSVPEADVPINDTDLTFSSLFFRALSGVLNATTPYDGVAHPPTIEWFLDGLERDWTYVFELTSPTNRIVVEYDRDWLTLIAIRDRISGQEFDIYGDILGDVYLDLIDRPKIWNILTIDGVNEAFKTHPPTTLEGFIACDASFNRVKLKSPSYVLAARANDAFRASPRNIMRAIIEGIIDDVLPMLPDDTIARVEGFRSGFTEYVRVTNELFTQWKDVVDRRTFAGFVKASQRWHPPFYWMMTNDESASSFFVDLVKRRSLTDSVIDAVLREIKVLSDCHR